MLLLCFVLFRLCKMKINTHPPHKMYEIEYSTLLWGLYCISSCFTSMFTLLTGKLLYQVLYSCQGDDSRWVCTLILGVGERTAVQEYENLLRLTNPALLAREKNLFSKWPIPLQVVNFLVLDMLYTVILCLYFPKMRYTVL